MQDVLSPDELDFSIEEERQPFTSAKITLIVAEQGGGKSTLLTARVVDDTFDKLTSVCLFMGKNDDGTDKWIDVPASPVRNEKNKALIGYANIYLPNREPKVVQLPTNACAVADKVKIFANYHLYGIRYYHCDLATILENINTELLMDAWVNLDEGYIGADNRNSMTMLNQILTQFEFQLRKRRVHLQIAYPLKRMAELRIKMARTEYIECTYDEKHYEVIADVKKDKERKKTVRVGASLYFPYYDTEERFKLPESRINRAIKGTY